MKNAVLSDRRNTRPGYRFSSTSMSDSVEYEFISFHGYQRQFQRYSFIQS